MEQSKPKAQPHQNQQRSAREKWADKSRRDTVRGPSGTHYERSVRPDRLRTK